MSLPPSPPELAERAKVRARPGLGILLAFGMSVLFWALMLLVAALWH
jgi:hypothetical protein